MMNCKHVHVWACTHTDKNCQTFHHSSFFTLGVAKLNIQEAARRDVPLGFCPNPVGKFVFPDPLESYAPGSVTYVTQVKG
jgi:hypothetical protein